MLKRYIILLAVFGVIFVPFFAFSAGLVPCGDQRDPTTGRITNMCTLCDLYILAQKIISFLMWTIAPVIATFAIAWGGFNILISGASPSSRNKGIDTIKKTVIGLLILFSSWIVINELLLFFSAGNEDKTKPANILQNPWNEVTCLPPKAAAAPGGAVMGIAYDGLGAPGEQAVPRQTLAAAGIMANTNYCSDFDTPIDKNYTGCTTLAQLPQNAILGLINLKNACGAKCTLYITGGTEKRGHTSHGPGLARVDVRLDSALSAYIVFNGGNPEKTILGPKYTIKGTTYLLESNPSHWHIEF